MKNLKYFLDFSCLKFVFAKKYKLLSLQTKFHCIII